MSFRQLVNKCNTFIKLPQNKTDSYWYFQETSHHWIITFTNDVLAVCTHETHITYLLTYLLSYSMEQSQSWEANQFSASQEFPHILWNPKVHYHIHKCLPPVPILSRIHITTVSNVAAMHSCIYLMCASNLLTWNLQSNFTRYFHYNQ